MTQQPKATWVAPESREYYLCPKTNSIRREDFVLREENGQRVAASRVEVRRKKREAKNKKGREARARRRWQRAMEVTYAEKAEKSRSQEDPE